MKSNRVDLKLSVTEGRCSPIRITRRLPRVGTGARQHMTPKTKPSEAANFAGPKSIYKGDKPMPRTSISTTLAKLHKKAIDAGIRSGRGFIARVNDRGCVEEIVFFDRSRTLATRERRAS